MPCSAFTLHPIDCWLVNLTDAARHFAAAGREAEQHGALKVCSFKHLPPVCGSADSLKLGDFCDQRFRLEFAEEPSTRTNYATIKTRQDPGATSVQA